MRKLFGERISSFELMCDGEMGLILAHLPTLRAPLNGRHPWYVFVEIGDAGGARDVQELLQNALSTAMESEEIVDAVIAESIAQAKAIWHFRFIASEANRQARLFASYDTSVALADIAAFLDRVREEGSTRFPTLRPLFIGHVGDGNVHLSFVGREGTEANHPRLLDELNAFVFDMLAELNGSITAEHGIWRKWIDQLAASTPPAAMTIMRAIKRSFDPLGILNPGVVLACERRRKGRLRRSRAE